MNEKLAINRKLRESIDANRNERGRMDVIFTKISTETMQKKHKLARLKEEVHQIQMEVQVLEDEIEQIRLDGEEFEDKCDQKATIILKELKEIALLQKKAEEHQVDPEKYTYLGENDLIKNLSIAQENMLRSRVSRSRWKAGQTKVLTDVMLTKYQENRNFIEKIHQASGTTTVSEMIEAFNRQYPFFNHLLFDSSLLYYTRCFLHFFFFFFFLQRQNILNEFNKSINLLRILKTIVFKALNFGKKLDGQ
jgi:hypothetical protein